MRRMRSTSASRLPPFNLILNRISPSRGIHSRRRIRQAVLDSRAHVGRFQRIAGADGMEHRNRRTRCGRHIAVEGVALEVGAEVGGQIAGHEARRIGLEAADAERLAVGVESPRRTGWRRRSVHSLGSATAGRARAAGVRRLQVRGLERAKQINRMAGLVARGGNRAQVAGKALHRPSRPTSCDAAGNAQALPSVIEPNPQASLPAPVRTRHLTFRIVTRSTVRPPNWCACDSGTLRTGARPRGCGCRSHAA